MNQVKRLAYVNNDIETLHIVLLWMSNIESIEIPERKDSPSNLIGMPRSLRSVKQKLQLHTVKNQLANNVSLDKCLANVTKWLMPNETAILPPFLSYLLIKVSKKSLLNISSISYRLYHIHYNNTFPVIHLRFGWIFVIIGALCSNGAFC